MMKLPVISSIIDNCKTINSDETLKSVIAYVDGNSQDKPEGVSDEDINRINEARNTYHSLGLTAAVAIPASSRNQALAKDFLIYMCSDQAQQIYSQALNGLTMNYGYNPEGVSTIKMGTLVRSVIDCYGNSGNPIPYVDKSSNLVSYGGLYLMNNKYATLLFAGNKTASQICTEIKNDLSNRWEIILKSAGIN